jgi:hypothetical protein
MKKSLVAGLAVLLVASVSAYAQGIAKRAHPPNPNLQMASGACAPGFTKQGAAGDPNSRYRYDCVMVAQCPGVSTQAAPVQHPGGVNSAQFGYGCSWGSAQQQGLPQSAVCAPGFMGSRYTNGAATSTMTGTNTANGTVTKSSNTTYRGSYSCTGRTIQCQAMGGLSVSMTSQAVTLTAYPRRAQFLYSCSYVRVN